MEQRALKDDTWFNWDEADEYYASSSPWEDPLYRTRHGVWVHKREIVSKAFAARWFVHRKMYPLALTDEIAALEV